MPGLARATNFARTWGDVHRYSAEFQDDVTGYDPSPISGAVLRIIRQLPDSTLIARKLADIDYVICAAPSYLKRVGTPRVPEDLREHDCLLYAQPTAVNELRLQGPDGEYLVKVSGRYQSNNSMPLRDAFVADIGIALMPSFYVYNLLSAGKLVPVLPEYQFERSGLYAVYPHNRHLAAKVKALIDFLMTRFASRVSPWQSSEVGKKVKGRRDDDCACVSAT